MIETKTEDALQYELLNTPLGMTGSGLQRYAAAMYFFNKSELSVEALEIYRICAKLDYKDPIVMLLVHGL